MLLKNCTILFCHKLCFQHQRVWSEGGRFGLSQSVCLLAVSGRGDCMRFYSCFDLRLHQLARIVLVQLTILVGRMNF